MVAAAFACAASEGIEWNAKGYSCIARADMRRPKRCTARRSMHSTAPARRQPQPSTHPGEYRRRAARRGRYAESEKLHREALPRLEELTGPSSLATARAVSNLAALYWSSGKLEQAEPLALRAESGFTIFRPPARRTVRPTA